MSNNPGTITNITNAFTTGYVNNYIDITDGTSTIYDYTNTNSFIGAFGDLEFSTSYSTSKNDYIFNYFNVNRSISSGAAATNQAITSTSTPKYTSSVVGSNNVFTVEEAKTASWNYYSDVVITVYFTALYTFDVDTLDITLFTDAAKFTTLYGSTMYGTTLGSPLYVITSGYNYTVDYASNIVVVDGLRYFKSGTVITVTLQYDTGFKTTKWTNNGVQVSTINPKICISTITSDTTVKAYVEELYFTLEMEKTYTNALGTVQGTVAFDNYTFISNATTNTGADDTTTTTFTRVGYYSNYQIKATPANDFRFENFVIYKLDDSSVLNSGVATNPIYMGYNQGSTLEFKVGHEVVATWKSTKSITISTARIYKATEGAHTIDSVANDNTTGYVWFDLASNNTNLTTINRTYDTGLTAHIFMTEREYTVDNYRYRLDGIYYKGTDGIYRSFTYVKTFVAGYTNVYAWDLSITDIMATDYYIVYVKQYKVEVNSLYESVVVSGGDYNNPLNGLLVNVVGTSGLVYGLDNTSNGSSTITMSQTDNSSVTGMLSSYYYTEGSTVTLTINNPSYIGGTLKQYLASRLLRQGTLYNNDFVLYSTSGNLSSISKSVSIHENVDFDVYFDSYYLINSTYLNKVNGAILSYGGTFTKTCTTTQSTTEAVNYYEVSSGTFIYKRNVNVNVVAVVNTSTYVFKNWNTGRYTDNTPAVPTGVTANTNTLSISVNDTSMFGTANTNSTAYTYYAKLLKLLTVTVACDTQNLLQTNGLNISTSSSYTVAQKTVTVEEGTMVYIYASAIDTAQLSYWEHIDDLTTIATATYPNSAFTISSGLDTSYSLATGNKIAFYVTTTDTTDANDTTGTYKKYFDSLFKI